MSQVKMMAKSRVREGWQVFMPLAGTTLDRKREIGNGAQYRGVVG